MANIRAEQANTHRCAENYAFNLTCGILFFKWSLEENIINIVEHDNYVAELTKQVVTSFVRADMETASRDAGDMFIVAIAELLASGKYITPLVSDKAPDEPQREILGYFNNDTDLPPENTATSYVIVFNQKEAGDEEKEVRH